MFFVVSFGRIPTNLLQLAVMSERTRNTGIGINQFYYSPQPESNTNTHSHAHPQHKYFKLYEKYTSEASEAFTFTDYQPKKKTEIKQPLQNESELQKARSRIRELNLQNQSLKEELREQKDQIERLKYQLYYCNTQLEQITKIETYEYQKAVNDLREEIELMLEKNKLTEEELANLKKNQENKRLRSQQAVSLNQDTERRALKFLYKQLQTAKENQMNYMNIQQQSKKQEETNRQFINGLKDMYAKIMGSSTKSLKQLWKWLKDLGQILNRLRKWRRKCRQFLKTSMFVSTQSMLPFLEEVMIIIN